MKKFLARGAGLIAVALFLLFNAATLVRWVHVDRTPLAWDESIHMRVALDYRERLRTGSLLDVLRPAYFNYPPLYHLSLVPFLSHTHDLADTGAYANVAYLTLLGLCVYFIGTRLVGAGPAVVAAVLSVGYPIIADQARFPMIDVPLSALVALCFLCLMKTEDFESGAWSAVFGAALGLATLEKWTAPGYLVGPAIPALFMAFRHRRWKGVGVAAVIFLAIILPWYSVNLLALASRIPHLAKLPPANQVFLPAGLGWTWYLLVLVDQMQLPLLLLFAAGAVLSWRNKALFRVQLWFWVSLALFTLLHNRNVRYTMPALPAAALLSVGWLSSKRRAALAGAALLAFGFYGYYQFFPTTWRVSVAGYPLPLLDHRPASGADWKHRDVIERIAELQKERGHFSKVVAVTNAPYFHSQTLNISRIAMGVDTFAFKGPSKTRWLEFAEYILYKTGDLGPEFTVGTVKGYADLLANPPPWFRHVYKEAGRWPLPDGSEAVLLQAAPDPVEIDAGLLSFSLDEMVFPRVNVRKVNITAVPLSQRDTRVGRLKSLTVSGQRIAYDDIVLSDAELYLNRPQINLPYFLANNDLQLLSLEEMAPSVTLNAESILELAAKKAPWLKEPSLRFDGPVIEIAGKAKGFPVTMRATVTVVENEIRTHLDYVKVAGIRVPGVFLRAYTDRRVDLRPDDEKPFLLTIRNISGSGSSLRVTGRNREKTT
jgi:hypothetical protein